MRQISKKRAAQLREYKKLITRLRKDCENKSEWDGVNATYSFSLDGYYVEPHHINGKNGLRLIDSLNIIMITSMQQLIQTEHLKGYISKEDLIARVKEIRGE